MFALRSEALRIMTLFFLLSSCDLPVTNQTTEKTFTDFTKIVFDASSSRLNSQYGWTQTLGQYSLTFTETNSQDHSGTFKLAMTSYIEPQLCSYLQTCTCSSIVEGTFVAVSHAGHTTSGVSGTYNPLTDNTSYDTISNDTTTSSSTVEEIAIVSAFDVSLVVTRDDSEDTCQQQSNRTIVLRFYSSGESILTDLNRDVLFVPRSH